MGFSRQEYWSGLSFPSPGDLPDPGIEPRSCALQADSTIWATRESLSQRLVHVFCCRASKEVSVIQDVLQFTNGSWEDILITLWFTLQVLQIQLKCVLSSHLGDLTQNQWQPWAYLLPSWWWVLHCLAQKHPEGCRDRGGGGACVRLKLVRKQNLVHLLIFSPRKLYRLVLHVPGRRNRILWSTPLLTVSLTYI